MICVLDVKSLCLCYIYYIYNIIYIYTHIDLRFFWTTWTLGHVKWRLHAKTGFSQKNPLLPQEKGASQEDFLWASCLICNPNTFFHKIPVDPPFVTTDISTNNSYFVTLDFAKNMDNTKVSDPGPASWMIFHGSMLEVLSEKRHVVETLKVCLFVCLFGLFVCLFVCLFNSSHVLYRKWMSESKLDVFLNWKLLKFFWRHVTTHRPFKHF